ncbi:30S ribosomal protein S15 [archaeon]|nr:MAG: 30S ribosomal protein S15 [archaeon]
MLANRAAIAAAILKWRRDERDTGSPEVQVAVMTERIRYLTSHLLKHPQDKSTKRGLTALVNDRRNNLNFLHSVDAEKARQMCAELGIRWKPPGQVWDKEAKYSAFKNTKNKKAEAKKLVKKRAKQALLDKQMAKKMRKMQVQY